MYKQFHKDVNFAVTDGSGKQRVFYNQAEAAGFAVSLAMYDGRGHNIDVLVYSEEGARAWSGEDGVTSYREDPEASVFERIEIKATSLGRIR